MKKLSTLLAIAFCSLSITEISAQSYFYATMIGDTVQLSVTNANGTIQWQQADDTLSVWSNIAGATTNPYIHLTESSGTGFKYYRAEVTNTATCALVWYSETIKHRIITSTTELQIGDFYGGGFVFYNFAGSGLIAAPSDLGTAQWGCYGTEVTGTSSAIGSGLANTNLIVAFHDGLPDYYGNPTQCNALNDGTVAAKLCTDYTDGIYSDWFLPSKDELNLLYTNLHLNGFGGFSAIGYWSSSEYDAGGAWGQYFDDGGQGTSSKGANILVRCVRSFSPPPPPNCGTITDIDGNIYNTVTIGSQCWMSENLKTTKYSDGAPLVDGTSAGDIFGNYTTKYMFDYGDNPANTVTYGKLYTWAAVMNGAVSSNAVPGNVQGVCPTGWHVPGDAEWNSMEKYLDSTVDTLATDWVGTDIGGKLKETGTTHWNSPNTGATNSSDFSALPGGYRDYGGTSSNVGSSSYWWTATQYDVTDGWERYLLYSNATVGRNGSNKAFGFSVRCVKDSIPPPTNCGTVTDIDGNIYNTVTIGSQCWMKENLKTTKYADNTPLVDGTSAGNITGNYTTKYMFDYANTPANTVTYGKLYTWVAVMNGAVSSNAVPGNVQGVCPTGWHVPGDAEWNSMEKYLDSTVDTTATGWVGTDIGGKLKETGTTHWNSPNTGATNSSGFTALPGGYRSYDGTFYSVGYDGYWWAATQYDASIAWRRNLNDSFATVLRYYYDKAYGFSVRCLKD